MKKMGLMGKNTGKYIEKSLKGLRANVFLYFCILTLTSPVLFAGCKKRVHPVVVQVADSIRHYYPIVAGEKLDISYRVYNRGNDPFLIEDIQPSCGCIVGDANAKIIPPNDSVTLAFTFDSSKNVGYVRHCIRIYGNVLPKGMATLVFDVNVVPPSDHDPDYEEIYQEKKERQADIKGLVDGTTSQKGYYIDESDSRDSRSHTRYPWRE